VKDDSLIGYYGGANCPTKSLVQEDKTREAYRQLKRDRESEETGHKRPLWRRDWRK